MSLLFRAIRPALAQAPRISPSISTSMDDQRARLRRLTLLFFLAALVRLLYWSEIRPTALDRWHEWDQSDMHTYIEQARRIAEGDWLGRDPFHPYHLWQIGLPESDWLAFYPPHSFHQAPAYSYALAALYPIAPRDLPAMKLLQILLGALACVLLHEIARALGGPLAGHIAGAIAAIYGPIIQIELQILREGPMIFLLCAVLASLVLHWKRSSEVGLDRLARWRLAGIGVVLAALTMLHETGQVAFIATASSVGFVHGLCLPARRSRRIEALLALACLGSGFAIGLSPLVARNLAVGAPPLSLSSRSGVVFLMSNYALSTDGGSRWGEADYAIPIIRGKLDGSNSGVTMTVLKSYVGQELLIVKNIWLKFRAVCAIRESPDNTSYSFYCERSAILKWLPTFWLIFAPAWGGLAILAWTGLRRSNHWDGTTSDERNRWALAMSFTIFFLGYLAALSLVHSLGRLRLCIVPIMIPLASIFFAQLIGFARRASTNGVSAGLAAFVFAAILQLYAHRSVGPSLPRPTDYVVAANLNRAAGELALAAEDYEQAIKSGAQSRAVYRALGETLVALGRADEAETWFRLAEQ